VRQQQKQQQQHYSLVAFDVIILVFSQYALQTFINAVYIVLEQQMIDDIFYGFYAYS
jgi:hypothetical protein